jgi:GNAT superfamily N-acetyltransferase
VHRLTGSDVLGVADELVDAYVEVFAEPPWNEDPERARAGFRRRLAVDARRPGFRAVLVPRAGFATAWTTSAPFRTDRAYPAVSARLGARRVDELLVGALEVDELAVLPRARGSGLGRRLLDAVTADAPRAWLLTSVQATDAVAFYRRMGWVEPAPEAGSESGVVVFLKPRTGRTGPAR